MLPFDVRSLIDSYDVGPISGGRPVKTQRASDGTWFESGTTPLTFSPIAVAPFRERTLDQSSKDANRTRRRVKIFTVTEILEGDTLAIPATLRGISGGVYRVTEVDPYIEQAGAWIGVAEKVDR